MDGSTEVAPEREAFAKQVLPSAPRSRPIRELHALLAGAGACEDPAQRLQWLDKLVRWLGRGALPAVEEQAEGEAPRSARLRLLVRALEQAPAFRAGTAQLIAGLLRDANAFYVLSRLGLPGDRSFLAETVDRISRRVLPSPRDERDLAQALERLFGKRKDAAWIAALDPELAAKLISALDAGGTTFAPLAQSAADAALLLATRVSALGLSDDIRVRSPRVPLRESPLFRLPRATDALLALLERGGGADQAGELEQAFHQVTGLLAECELTVRGVTQNLEQFGVSVDVVYRLEVMTKNMDRLHLLLEQLMPRAPAESARCFTRLLSRLIEDRIRDRSTLDLARTNLHLLARKIIERAGHTGEHYITATRGEYAKMMASAAGGGVLTAGTTTLKFAIAKLQLAPFVEGMFAATNYAGSFLVMQALGFTLATKQPSMTAAALAATLRERSGDGATQLDELVSMIARITRSQLAAAIGNIGLVVPAALALDRVHVAKLGQPFLDPETAAYVLHSLDPLHSGTLFYAAFTGVLLWISSIAAGWVENWAVYRRLPEAIAHHRIGRFVGRRVTQWFSRVFSRNVSGVGGNVSLGLLLGMTPVFGKFFGLPFDVRHVTLSTGALAFAVSSLGLDAVNFGLLPAIAGIAAIGLLNFGVSFVLALLVALRAREVDRPDQLRLVRAVLSRLATRPKDFILPP